MDNTVQSAITSTSFLVSFWQFLPWKPPYIVTDDYVCQGEHHPFATGAAWGITEKIATGYPGSEPIIPEVALFPRITQVCNYQGIIPVKDRHFPGRIYLWVHL
jgi:hypothetical protein